jgi:hypothetical protein
MTTNVQPVRERTRKQQAAAKAEVARTPDPHPLLALQRSAGNRAVNALISRRRGPGHEDESLLEPEFFSPAQGAADLDPQRGALPAVQQDIHFAPGQFNPDEELLGHEVWHVRQQRQGRAGLQF